MSEQPAATRNSFGPWEWGLLLTAAVVVGGSFLIVSWLRHTWEEADRAHENLSQVARAMLDYAKAHKDQLPPDALRNKLGKTLLSWRVLILPQLGEEALFREFELDEPWDSPHNIKLLQRMPSAFAPPPGR